MRRYWRETWGDVVWRANMLTLLSGFSIVIVACIIVARCSLLPIVPTN